MAELTLPLGTSVTYRGMTGRDEDLLTNVNKVRSGEALDELMANCVSRLAVPGADEKTNIRPTDITKLGQPDRTKLILQIRRESYGDTMRAELKCTNPTCGNQFSVDVDLSQLPEKPAPEGERPYPITITVNGEAVNLKVDYLDGVREKQLAKTKEDLLTMGMFLRIRSVDGIHPNKVMEWLKDLPVRARKQLRDELMKLECGVQTSSTADCPSCGEEVAFDVQQQPGFFFPAE